MPQRNAVSDTANRNRSSVPLRHASVESKRRTRLDRISHAPSIIEVKSRRTANIAVSALSGTTVFT
jgi:hypothetical protein